MIAAVLAVAGVSAWLYATGDGSWKRRAVEFALSGEADWSLANVTRAKAIGDEIIARITGERSRNGVYPPSLAFLGDDLKVLEAQLPAGFSPWIYQVGGDGSGFVLTTKMVPEEFASLVYRSDTPRWVEKD